MTAARACCYERPNRPMPPREPQSYTLAFAAAVPVGHRVELLFYAEGDEVNAHEPLLRDLDTGVVYATGWHYEARSAARAESRFGEVKRYPEALRTGLVEAGRAVGRVLSCRVLTVREGVQTALRLALEAEGHVYR